MLVSFNTLNVGLQVCYLILMDNLAIDFIDAFILAVNLIFRTSAITATHSECAQNIEVKSLLFYLTREKLNKTTIKKFVPRQIMSMRSLKQKT